jgi:hypothetical protein
MQKVYGAPLAGRDPNFITSRLCRFLGERK